MKNILVIDGNSILNRAFYGIRPLTTRDGKNTNALYGMISIIGKQMESIHPDYAAVAFDVHVPNFRKERCDFYKAGRHPTPPELLEQFPYAKECLRLFGVPVLELPRYEADDILGTVAQFAETTDGLHAYVLTGDRDMMQLISDHVTVLYAATSETLAYNAALFTEKFGVKPCQFIDMKAIMGDSSDNIPGVPGIGQKGAEELLRAFGTLDGVYENIDDARIKKGMRDKLIAGKDSAYVSRFLATIEVHAPLGKTLEDLAYTGIPDKAALRRFFTEMEFQNYIRRFCAEDAESQSAPCDACADYTEVDAETLLSLRGNRFAVEADDNGFCFSDGTENYRYTGDVNEISSLFSADQTILVYDGKALYHRLETLSVPVNAEMHDLMLCAYVENPQNGDRGVRTLLASVLGKIVPDTAPAAHLYAEAWDKMTENLKKTDALDLLYNVELPLLPVLCRMESAGFALDTDGLSAFGEALRLTMEQTEAKIYEEAGEVFNVNSPKQLGEVLFEKLGLPYKKKKTKTGYSTDAEVLSSLRYAHPIIDLILDYRQVAKLYSTYAVGLLKAVDENGRLHTDFKQAQTQTGRLSSAEPNLQNIPIRTELGREMRRFFYAPGENRVLIDADYSQIELRLLAAISGDDTMISAFINGEDIHRKTAATVFGIADPENVPDDLRKRAKAINFGIVYGISAFSLSEDLGISVGEAKTYIESYLATYPKIDAYLRETVASAEENGYATTLFGRRRYIPELKSSNFNLRSFGKRVAMNSPIQGTAADVIKIAMIRVDRRLREENLDAYLVMQVHDELILEAAEKDSARAAAILKEEMENAAHLAVPLTAEISIGKTWLCKQ